MSETEKDKTPEELVDCGIWEVEPFYYGGQRGKIFRSRATTDVQCFKSYDGFTYRIGDTVYIDAVSTEAYLIGTIVSFKSTKRDVFLTVGRFYRPEEVPEDSLSIMEGERGEGGECMVKPREIFSSDNQCTHSVSLLRSQCTVYHVKDIVESREYDLSLDDTFFSCVLYNQESTRLASHNGEIRVGPSHQAKLPPDARSSVGEEKDRDELLFRPGQIDGEKQDKYVKMARTFRMVLLESGNIHEAEKGSRCRDMLLDDAISTLHRCNYSFGDAIKEMNANDQLLNADANFMTIEDTKKFTKGIKTMGKNFTRISKEMLPLHSRDQLVAFYYLWKKTPDAIKPKALNNRNRGAAGLRRGKKDKNSRPPSRELNDYASANEEEVELFDENKRLQYACHHCYGSESKDWHHAGKEPPMLLCTECRIYYKKYGQMRSVEKPATVPSCLFKRSNSETDQEEEAGVRTRAGKKENGRKRSPSYGEEGGGETNGDDEKKMKRLSNGKRKKSLGDKNGKRRKEDIIREEDDDDKKSSSNSPSPSGDKDMKKDEEEEKEENGANVEIIEKKETEEASTMNGDDNGSDESESVEECYEALDEYPHGTPYRVYRRGNGNSCSRTDIITTTSAANIAKRKETAEVERQKNASIAAEARKKELAAQSQSNTCQPGPSNGLHHPQPRIPMQTMPQLNTHQEMANFLNTMARQAIPTNIYNPPHFTFDMRQLGFLTPQMAHAFMDQNQQLAAKMANQREMEALMRRQAVPSNFGLNGTNGPVVFNNPLPINIPPHLMAAMQQNHHNGAFSAPGMDAQNFARQSQIQQMMASGMSIPASAAMGLNPEMETILRIHHDIQAAGAAQTAAAQSVAPPPPPSVPTVTPTHDPLQQMMMGRSGPELASLYQQMAAGMANGMTNGNNHPSEMMRKLQQDSFK